MALSCTENLQSDTEQCYRRHRPPRALLDCVGVEDSTSGSMYADRSAMDAAAATSSETLTRDKYLHRGRTHNATHNIRT